MTYFSEEEFLRRADAVKARMAERGIDTVIVTEAANMSYLTGFTSTLWYHPVFVVLSVQEDKPYWIGREFTDKPAAEITTYLPSDRIIGYPETLASHFLVDEETRTTKDPMGFLVNFLKEKGWAKGRVGVEMASRLLSYPQVTSLLRQLSGVDVVDATTLVDWCRFVKSDVEIQCMREAGKIASHSMSVTLANINDAARQCDVASVAYQASLAGTRDYGGCLPECFILTSGASVPAIHVPWTDGPFAKNQLANIELSGCREFYNTALVRSAVVGKPPEDVKNLFAVLKDAFDVIIDTARAGVSCGDVTKAFRAPFEKAGIKSRPWMGYSIGLGLPGQGWIDAPPGLTDDETTLLEANMTFHVVPCFWVESSGGWAMAMSETLLICDDAPSEPLSSLDRSLWVA
ncbi:MAG: Xaa-Pro peptidase family protein [Pseudomonadota bacterium]